MTMFVFIIKFGFPIMAIIIDYKAQSTPFSMEHRAEYLAHTIRRILDFLQLWFILSKSFTKL
jgi:hypothetical protein